MSVNTVSDPWVGAEIVDISTTDHTFTARHVHLAFKDLLW
jgi:hypothetical protein